MMMVHENWLTVVYERPYDDKYRESSMEDDRKDLRSYTTTGDKGLR